MSRTEPLPAEAGQLLKIYLSGGAIPGNVNPLVLIELAKRSGDYEPLLREAKAIRALRDRIRSFAETEGLTDTAAETQIRAYISAVQSPEERKQLSWLLGSLDSSGDKRHS
jgi:hypothetical protein